MQPSPHPGMGPELLRALVERDPDAKVVVDVHGEVLMANDKAAALFGAPPSELVGRPVTDLVPEEHHEALERLRRAVDAQQRQVSSDAVLERFHARTVLGERFAVGVAVVPLDTAGTTAVTVRPLLGAREDDQFRMLLEAGPDAMVIVDNAGVIVFVNAQTERLFGYPRSDMVGRPVEMLVPPSIRAVHPSRRATFGTETPPRPMGSGRQLYAARRDGEEFPVDISLSPLHTENGTLVLAAVRDVSAWERLRSEADRLRDQLIATVSHELRTPLTSIIGYTEMLGDLDDEHLSDQARRLLAVIERNAARELRLVNDLLTLAAPEGPDAAQHVDVDLADLARTSVRSMLPVATEHGVRLELAAPVPVSVRGDHERLGQVVDNLLSNAVKFTPDGGQAVVRVCSDDGWAVVEVADTGVGMTEEEQGLVFERLYRAPGVVAAHIQGAGLGLPIVQAIVEGYEGTVAVESAPGEGTVVRVRLPLPDAPDSRAD